MPPSRHRATRAARLPRLARWSQSWRLALRLAARDARAHRGRSILIMIMVLAPALLIGSAATWASTDDLSAAESLPTTLGHSQAMITSYAGVKVDQLPDPNDANGESGSEPALPFGDHQPDEEWTTTQLAALTGGTVFAVDYPLLLRGEGTAIAEVEALAIDHARLPESGLARLVSGRWPATADEMVITEAGLRSGLPVTGLVGLRGQEGAAAHGLTVVGVVEASHPDRRRLHAVVDDAVREWLPVNHGQRGYLVQRPDPVTWAEVRAWNAYGLLVLSRAVVLDPPPASEQSPELRQQARDQRAAILGLAALIAVGLLLETTLLAGPAFAVSAARQRRSVALIASNGAERSQLRRYVLSQALLLGGLAAAAGALLGLAGGAGLIAVQLWLEPRASVGPFDPPWVVIGVLVLAATLSSVVAALVPARGAATLDIADVLAGRERSRPIRGRTPLLGGMIMFAAAGVLLARLLAWPGTDIGAVDVLATVVLVLSGLFLVGGLLVVLGGLVGRLPLPVRLPVRDAARQRSRSSSAIAAVMVTVATMTILVVANASDDRQGARDYETDQVVGHGYVYGEEAGAGAVRARIAEQHPDWEIRRLDWLGPEGRREGTGRESAFAVRPRGCSAVESISLGDFSDPARCSRVGLDGDFLLLATNRRAVANVALPARAAEIWQRGGMLVADRTWCSTGRSGSVIGSVVLPDYDQVRVERELSVPGAVVAAEELARLTQQNAPNRVMRVGGVLPLESAEQLGLPTQVMRYEVIDPDGPISRADERAINEGSGAGSMEVERGYVSEAQTLIWVMLAVSGALVLVAALVATALAQAEGQADLATLAALGGTLGTRRRLVAVQAAVIAGLGAGLGLLLGLLPGSTVALSLTSIDMNTGETVAGLVVIPWIRLGLVVLGIPVLAAALAALAVRRAPILTRRLT